MKWFAAAMAVLFMTTCVLAENAAEQDRAASRLKLAVRLHAAGKDEVAKEWYADIVKRWPNTDAAQEARRLLGGKSPDEETVYISPVAALEFGSRSRAVPPPVAGSHNTSSSVQSASLAGSIAPEAVNRSNRSTKSEGVSSDHQGGLARPGAWPNFTELDQRSGAGAMSPASFIPSNHTSEVQVRGYWKKNGTYVQPHTRSWPRR